MSKSYRRKHRHTKIACWTLTDTDTHKHR